MSKRKPEKTLAEIRAKVVAMHQDAERRILAEIGKKVPDGKAFLPFGWHSRLSCKPNSRPS